MAENGNEGTSKGIVGVGAAALLALVAKAEHCAAAGAKAIAPTAILAEEGARAGARVLPALGEEAAIGVRALPGLASDGALAAGVGAKTLRPSAALGVAADAARGGAGPLVARSFQGVGLRTGTVKAAIGRGAAISSDATTHGALEHFLPTGLDLASSSFDIASLVTDDTASPRDGLPFTPTLRGGKRSMFIALTPAPEPAETPTGLRLRSLQIEGVKGVLGAVNMFGASSPFVIASRVEGAGIHVPKDAPASPEGLLAASASLGAGVVLAVCPPRGDDVNQPDYSCETAVESAQRRVDAKLRNLLVPREPWERMNTFSRWMVDELAASPAARESEVYFLSFDATGAVAVVRRSDAPPATQTAPSASVAPSASSRRPGAPPRTPAAGQKR